MKKIQRKIIALIAVMTILFSTGTVAMAAEVNFNDIKQKESMLLEVKNAGGVQTASNLTEVANVITGSLSKTIPNSGTVTINKSCDVYIVFCAKATSGSGSATYKVTIGGKSTYVTADGVARTYPLGSFSKGSYSYKIQYNAGSTATYAFAMQLVG